MWTIQVINAIFLMVSFIATILFAIEYKIYNDIQYDNYFRFKSNKTNKYLFFVSLSIYIITVAVAFSIMIIKKG